MAKQLSIIWNDTHFWQRYTKYYLEQQLLLVKYLITKKKLSKDNKVAN